MNPPPRDFWRYFFVRYLRYLENHEMRQSQSVTVKGVRGVDRSVAYLLEKGMVEVRVILVASRLRVMTSPSWPGLPSTLIRSWRYYEGG